MCTFCDWKKHFESGYNVILYNSVAPKTEEGIWGQPSDGGLPQGLQESARFPGSFRVHTKMQVLAKSLRTGMIPLFNLADTLVATTVETRATLDECGLWLLLQMRWQLSGQAGARSHSQLCWNYYFLIPGWSWTWIGLSISSSMILTSLTRLLQSSGRGQMLW